MRIKRCIRYLCVKILIVSLCNGIPTCAGLKAQASRSFAMPVTVAAPHIINFSPTSIWNTESAIIKVRGLGFTEESTLLVKRFKVPSKYYTVVDNENLLVKVPKGVPAGKYPVQVKNADNEKSNKIYFEVKKGEDDET